MKRYSLLLILGFVWVYSNAQQPFEKYGYKVKVATLSKGKYVEAFDQDTVVQIGSIIMNRRTGKIISFVTYDTVRRESDLQPELISRWWSPDPLADEFYNESPYNFVHNNPIMFTDPDGREASPYYDQDGHFLGNDENGFTGQVYVTNKETFDKNSKGGVADSKGIQSDQSTTQIQKTDLTAAAYSNIYTDILSQTGYDVSKLAGGAIAVNNGTNDQYNNPSQGDGKGYASTYGNLITVFQTMWDAKNLLTTVENVQSTVGDHEYVGHMINGYGISAPDHYKAYDEQMNHSEVWEGTSSEFRMDVINKGKSMLRSENKTEYHRRYPLELNWKK